MMVPPLSLVFLTLVHVMDVGHTSMTPFFITGYLAAAMFQVVQCHCLDLLTLVGIGWNAINCN